MIFLKGVSLTIFIILSYAIFGAGMASFVRFCADDEDKNS